MSIDLSKLTPAKWGPPVSVLYQMLGEVIAGFEVGNDVLSSSAFCRKYDDAAFAALARNAFDVMMRRGWGSVRINGEWHVCINHQEKCWQVALDPFTALVEADAWLTEREKANA